jgi:hypothetical protein
VAGLCITRDGTQQAQACLLQKTRGRQVALENFGSNLRQAKHVEAVVLDQAGGRGADSSTPERPSDHQPRIGDTRRPGCNRQPNRPDASGSAPEHYRKANCGLLTKTIAMTPKPESNHLDSFWNGIPCEVSGLGVRCTLKACRYVSFSEFTEKNFPREELRHCIRNVETLGHGLGAGRSASTAPAGRRPIRFPNQSRQRQRSPALLRRRPIISSEADASSVRCAARQWPVNSNVRPHRGSQRGTRSRVKRFSVQQACGRGESWLHTS